MQKGPRWIPASRENNSSKIRKVELAMLGWTSGFQIWQFLVATTSTPRIHAGWGIQRVVHTSYTCQIWKTLSWIWVDLIYCKSCWLQNWCPGLAPKKLCQTAWWTTFSLLADVLHWPTKVTTTIVLSISPIRFMKLRSFLHVFHFLKLSAVYIFNEILSTFLEKKDTSFYNLRTKNVIQPQFFLLSTSELDHQSPSKP